MGILEKNENLGREVVRNSKLFKNSIEISEHNAIIGRMNKEIKELKE